MRLLVTGREGQVARALAERIAPSDSVAFAARPDLDLRDTAKLPDVIARAIDMHRPDLLVSAAAYTAVDRAEDEPEAAEAVNATAPGILAEAAARTGIPIVHLSTDYVFDGTADRPYEEDDPVAPLGVYGRTKEMGERAVREGHPHGHVVLRTAWVYSPFGANFVKTMLRLAETRDRLNVVDDQFGNPTSAFDIADGVLALARKGVAWGRTFHLAGTGDTNWADFAREIFRCAGGGCTVEGIGTDQYHTKARRPANSRLNTARLKAATGFAAPRWETSLALVIERLGTHRGDAS